MMVTLQYRMQIYDSSFEQDMGSKFLAFFRATMQRLVLMNQIH